MRPHGSPLFLTIVVLLLISIVVFLTALHGRPLENLLALAPKKHTVPKPDVRAWANKQTGLYYCPDSKLYGGTETGRYMSQEQALQAGYRPAAEEYCH